MLVALMLLDVRSPMCLLCALSTRPAAEHLCALSLHAIATVWVACKQEDRQWALRRGLEEINKEIEAASRSGIASCWFPMGTRNERIIRLAAKEASLLNSRYLQLFR